VIQRGCSTAIEAGIAGVPTLLPEWIEVSYPRPAAEQASLICSTEEHLTRELDQILRGRFQATDADRARLQGVIDDWFYRADGQAYRRVAEVILSHLPQPARAQRRNLCGRWARRMSPLRIGGKKWIRHRIAGTLRRLPVPPHWPDRIEPRPFADWDHSPKRFSADQVRSIADNLLNCQQARAEGLDIDVRVSSADVGEDYLFGSYRGRSVVISPPPRAIMRSAETSIPVMAESGSP
jgi:hypothetical protein